MTLLAIWLILLTVTMFTQASNKTVTKNRMF